MAKLSSVKIDPDLETKGVWVAFEGDMKFLIARAGNPAFQERMRKLREPIIDALRRRSADPEKVEAMIQDAVAHHVLLDWENVTDDEGKPIHYTPEVGIATFANPGYRDVYRFVMEVANDGALYRQRVTDDAQGN